MKKYILIALSLLMAGCCSHPSDSPDTILYNLNRGFTGKASNIFFTHYGYPVALFEHADGNKEYVWTSAGQKTARPPAASVNTNYTSEGAFTLVNTYHGVIDRQYCELRVYTDIAENVTGFVIAVDSIGKYSPSRCSELFDKTYP